MSSFLAGPKRLKQFIDATIQEMYRVSWPDRTQTVRLTSIVIGVCVILGAFLTAWDYILSQGLKLLIK